VTPLWFWQHTEHEQVIEPPHLLDPEIYDEGEKAGKSFARQRANEKRHREAQLTEKQLKALAEYKERHPNASARQAERDLGIPRRKIKWPKPTP
jgi:hypothetical protein